MRGQTGKLVLRALAKRKLPSSVANKPKAGFGVPIGTWTDGEFKVAIRDLLLSSSCKVGEYYRPEIYRPIVEAFCDGKAYQGMGQNDLHRWIILLLSVQLNLNRP